MRGTLSRRRLLRSAATVGLGATALALVGCSSDDDPEPDDAPQQSQQQSQQQDQPSTAQQQQQEAPAAAQAEQPGAQQEQAAQQAPPLRPTPGGIMRSYLPIDRFDTWDPHRSRYRYAQNVHSLVYSRLLQPTDPHTGELQADLCGLPEMPDQSTYVFTLDPRATFWDQPPTDGRPVGVDDIRLNIERQQQGVDTNGAPDVYLFRRRDWNRAAFAPGDEGTFSTVSERTRRTVPRQRRRLALRLDDQQRGDRHRGRLARRPVRPHARLGQRPLRPQRLRPVR